MDQISDDKKPGDTAGPAQCYRKVLELDPQNAKAREELERMQNEQGKK